jgi:hypothetical protein
VAADYLPIQASAVPCERVFSELAETDTLRRNNIHPVLMEILQTLKFAIKQSRREAREAREANITPYCFGPEDLEDPSDADLLFKLFSNDAAAGSRADRIDRIIRAIEMNEDDA